MASRVARKPINIPAGVEVKLADNQISVKGPKGTNTLDRYRDVDINIEGCEINIAATTKSSNAMAGTIRAILANHIMGVSQGFEKKLRLVGVGYRASSGKQNGRAKLDLTLGLSHPVTYVAPEGVEITTPSQVEILVSGINKQLVGQVAADIRGINKGVRKPEPYKGKGIRYDDEHIVMKEAKKK